MSSAPKYLAWGIPGLGEAMSNRFLADKLSYEDPRKWLDTNVKPVWEN